MTIKRLQLAQRTGTGASNGTDPFRPNVSGSYVEVAHTNNWFVVLQSLPDGTAAQNAVPVFTIADFILDANGNVTDIDTATLTGPQKTAWSTRLTNAGASVPVITAFNNNVTTFKDLAVFIARVFCSRADIDETFVKFRSYVG